MSVTDRDREKARHIVANWSLHFDPDDHDPLRAMIETFLADEREKALAPFLALAERFSWDTMREPDWTGTQVAEAIRRVAEVTE